MQLAAMKSDPGTTRKGTRKVKFISPIESETGLYSMAT